jgi:hypothetical protein
MSILIPQAPASGNSQPTAIVEQKPESVYKDLPDGTFSTCRTAGTLKRVATKP